MRRKRSDKAATTALLQQALLVCACVCRQRVAAVYPLRVQHAPKVLSSLRARVRLQLDRDAAWRTSDSRAKSRKAESTRHTERRPSAVSPQLDVKVHNRIRRVGRPKRRAVRDWCGRNGDRILRFGRRRAHDQRRVTCGGVGNTCEVRRRELMESCVIEFRPPKKKVKNRKKVRPRPADASE